jgi:SAM-dependent methyltransferase
MRAGLRRVRNGLGGMIDYASCVLADGLALATGRADRLVQPKRLQFIGDGDFEQIGASFLRYFVELGGLAPDHRVLDVGCGVGRMAAPLTRFLSRKGSYDGFDIVPGAIRWCTRRISRRYPNFRFQLANVHNRFYHPQGQFRASEYAFPYGGGTFDFAFATSVFTHMLPEDMGNYLSEIARVLKSGGTCLITYFLMNEQSKQLLQLGQSTVDFPYQADGYHVSDETRPEALVSYDEVAIRDAYEERGLSIVEPIHYGSWCARPRYLSFQDIVVARKQ